MIKKILIPLLLLSSTFAVEKVDEAFLGKYKLISTEKGECAESAYVRERDNGEYSVWISYWDEADKFLSNDRFAKFNKEEAYSYDTCTTAGPVNPYCFVARKSAARYNGDKKTLEKFSALKKTLRRAEYEYTKLEVVGDDLLKVTTLEMLKPYTFDQFKTTPIDIGATYRPPFTFISIKENSVCVFSKQ